MKSRPLARTATAEKDGAASWEYANDTVTVSLRWVLVGVAIAVVASSVLLTSPPSASTVLSQAIKDGQVGDALANVIGFLCLAGGYPTLTGSEVKSLPLGLGAGVAALIAGLALIRQACRSQPAGDGLDTSTSLQPERYVQWLGRVQLVDVAQALLVLAILWSVISRGWSPAPDLSIRATAVLAIQAIWALMLSRGLSLLGAPAAAVRVVAIGIVLSCLASTGLALRLQGIEQWPAESFFPVGPARMYAACMIPGAILALSWLPSLVWRIWQGAARAGMGRWLAFVLGFAALVLTVVLLTWGIIWAGSRAAWLGCVVGMLALVWLSVARRAKLVITVVGLILLIATCTWGVRFATSNGAIEAADLRLSGYGARYALQTWARTLGTGAGQGGFAITCEGRPAADQIEDPTALTVRWDGRANCEWLETLANLGLVGFHLTIGVYVVTLIAGTRALKRLEPGPLRRCLIGLLAALLAMAVEECVASSLRLTPLPVLWYTVLAAIWAILLSHRPEQLTTEPNRIAHIVGAVAVVGLGIGATALNWRDFSGEHDLALADRYLDTGRFDKSVEAADQALRGVLSPQHHVRALLTLARAHLASGTLLLRRVYEESARTFASWQQETQPSGTPASQPGAPPAAIRALWNSPSFRTMWDEAERRLGLALRALGDAQAKIPDTPGRAAFEADVCHALVGLWRLRANLISHDDPTVIEQVHRFERRRLQAFIEALEREPFDEGLVASLLRTQEKLRLDEVIDRVRRPLRNPMVSDEYRSLVLQVSMSEGFEEQLRPFLARANQDAAAAGERPWVDAFSPETLRMSAIIFGAKNEPDRAIRALSQAIRLYATKYNRLSVQQARAMSDLGWYRLVTQPTRPEQALGILQQALVVSGRPLGHPSLDPIYRRMIHALLAAGNEAAARDLSKVMTWQGRKLDPDAVLGWSYEVLARAFHWLGPDKRPERWRAWVERAAQLTPMYPGTEMLVAIMASEDGNDDRAAACLERAWRQDLSTQDRQECLRVLLYALKWNPKSQRLAALRRRISQEIRAATQPATANRPEARTSTQ